MYCHHTPLLRSIATGLLFLGFPFLLKAQLGINGTYRFSSAPEWNILDLSNNRVTELPGAGWSVGIEYAYSLRNNRLEFAPELNLTRYQAEELDLGPLDANLFSFFLNVRAYVLDFKGDCDCPTFSKKGNTLAKGFYVELSPGYTYALTYINTPAIRYRGRSVNLSAAASVGLDFGISPSITLTPFGGFRYYPEATWYGLEQALLDNPDLGNRQTADNSPLSQFYTGLRLGVNLRR
jgi:hypothetical protein